MDNRQFSRSEAYEDLGPTLRSTSYGEDRNSSQPSAKVQVLIAELGLRYRPSAQADLGAHAAMLALLVRDLEDSDPSLLEFAITFWAKHTPAKQARFMPKAAELSELMEKERGRRRRLAEVVVPLLERPRMRELPTDRRLTDAEVERLRAGDHIERALFLSGKEAGRFVLVGGSRFTDTFDQPAAA